MRKKRYLRPLLGSLLGVMLVLLLDEIREIGLGQEGNRVLPWAVSLLLLAGMGVTVLLFRNLKAQERTEAALTLAEAKFRELFNSTADAILIHDSDGVLLEVNQAACQRLEYSREELVGVRLFDVIAHGQGSSVSGRMDALRQRGHVIFESEHRSRSGRILPVEVHSKLIEYEGRLAVLAVGRDISGRREAEEALRESEARLRVVFETSPAGIFQTDPTGRIVLGNQSMADLFGCPLSELLGSNYLDHVHPTERGAAEAGMGKLLRGEVDRNSNERLYQRQDGSAFWGYLSGRRLQEEGEGHSSLVGIIEDISERKAARDALEQEKERLAVTLRSIGDGVITTDVDGRIVLLNRVAETLCGIRQESARGRPLREVFRVLDEKTRTPVPNPVDEVMRSGRTVELADGTILLAADGTERFIADSAAPIRDSAGQTHGVVLVFRDVTEKKSIEEELIRARKLESLGVLAGGIAHDFNNLLTGIIGNLSLARLRLDDAESLAPILERAEKAGDRAADLTKQLLTFSKGGAPVKKLAFLQHLLVEAAEFSLSGANVRPAFELQEDLWPVEVDVGQLSQVVHNLVLNAAQAMPSGGIVTIKAENVPDGDPAREGRVRITVRDEGAGIRPEDLHRIFDPYFTTKENGTGLGLATVYSIVRNHGGDVRVFSEPGRGATFVIYLPATARAVPAAESSQPAWAHGKGRVLVMDDDEMIRDLLASILESLGYEPETCAEGAEALELYRRGREAGRPFRAVIMDLTIPGGIGGKEAVQKLLEIDATARVIVSSGYSNDPVLGSYRRYGFCGAVAKPYRAGEVAAVLSEVLRPEA